MVHFLLQKQIHDKGGTQRIQGVYVAGHQVFLPGRYRDLQLRIHQLPGKSGGNVAALRWVLPLGGSFTDFLEVTVADLRTDPLWWPGLGTKYFCWYGWLYEKLSQVSCFFSDSEVTATKGHHKFNNKIERPIFMVQANLRIYEHSFLYFKYSQTLIRESPRGGNFFSQIWVYNLWR